MSFLNTGLHDKKDLFIYLFYFIIIVIVMIIISYIVFF